MEKKICFITDSIFSYGGVQRVNAVIAKELTKYYKITIITFDKNIDLNLDIYNLNQSSINIISFKYPEVNKTTKISGKIYGFLYKKILPKTKTSSFLYSLSSFPSVRRNALTNTINKGDYDIVIGVHAFISIRLATIRRDLNVNKVIGWMHNSYQAFFENHNPYLRDLREHFIYQMQKLDNTIVLTNVDAMNFKEKLGLDTTVIYNPLTLKPGKRCDLNSRIFLAVGRMSYLHKGFDLLIKAFKIFAEENKEWKLDIVGDGPEKESLQRLIDGYKLSDIITIHPFTKDIQKHYSSANVFVLSSRWEGFPLVIMEALSHGLPTITSDIPVCKEFFKDNIFNIYFKCGDYKSLARSLEKMSENRNLKQFSDSAFSFSLNNNNIKSIIKEWKKLFES